MVKLSDSGLAWSERFTFYDQVHTTGMDIKQAVDACAALTLGKDMYEIRNPCTFDCENIHHPAIPFRK